MEEITLCLRQEDSVQVDQNGVYTSTLAHPVELREGDEVSIKSVFLDTQDVIHVPVEGLPIELRGCKYLVNYNINQKADYQTGNTTYPAGGIHPLCGYVPDSQPMTYKGTLYNDPTSLIPVTTVTGDNELYWLADAQTNTAAGNAYFIVNIGATPLHKGRGGARYGGCSAMIDYTSKDAPAGVTFDQTMTIHIPSYQEDRAAKHPIIPVPSQAHKASPTVFYRIACKDIDGAPSIRHSDQDPTYLPSNNIEKLTFPLANTGGNPQPITAAAGTTQIVPQYFSWKATVPGGDYTPQEIAAWLTDNLIPVEKDGPCSANYDTGWSAVGPNNQTKFPSESPFLETILQNDLKIEKLNAVPGTTITHKQVFVNASKADPTNPEILDATYAGVQCREFDLAAMKNDYAGAVKLPIDRWVGTNQLSISFDENEKKLKFDVAHFPIYTNSTVTTGVTNADAQPGVQYNELMNETPASDPFDPAFPGNVGNERVNGDSGLAKAYSGIAFTAMTPPAFWSTQLGFDDTTISIEENSAISYFPAYDATKEPYVANSFTINNVIAGQTITEGLASIAVPVVTSSAVQYTGGPKGLFAKPIMTDGTPGSGPQVSIGDVDAIFADRVYNENAGGVGFFLIDIANNFQMDFVGENTRSQLSTNGINGKDTMSIVSRYYTSNNFVSDQGSGSIVYTHSGANRNLTQLAVRVKNPDGTFVDDTTLGNKNTVFLKITRAKPIFSGGSTLPSSPPPKE